MERRWREGTAKGCEQGGTEGARSGNERKMRKKRGEGAKEEERVGGEGRAEREIQGGARVLTRAATPSRFVLLLSFRLVSSHHAASVFLLQYDPRGPSASTVHHCMLQRPDRVVRGRFIPTRVGDREATWCRKLNRAEEESPKLDRMYKLVNGHGDVRDRRHERVIFLAVSKGFRRTPQ